MVYVLCPSSYYLLQRLLINILTDCNWSDSQETIFTAEMLWACIPVQLDHLHFVPTDWADYRTEYISIAANYTSVEYFVVPSKPCK